MNKNEAPPRVWILTGSRQGDNNQLRALAEALGWPWKAKRLTYNRLRHLAFARNERLLYLTRASRRALRPPWPDVVIGLGYESLPVSRLIRRKSGGRTRLIQIGNPRSRIADIDLVITTPQYRLEEATNLVALPFPIGNPAKSITANAKEERWLAALPRPRHLVAVGGATRQWKLDTRELGRAILFLREKRDFEGGSVIAATSRRTPKKVVRLLRTWLRGHGDAVVEDFPRFAVLLANCDRFYVTADSVSMLSEAILTGKPVAMIPISRSIRGKTGNWLRKMGLNLRSNADLSRFWGHLRDNRLVGTVEAPLASTVPDSVDTAVSAVREALGRR